MKTTHYTSIFDYITTQETSYQQPIPMNDSWSWSMKDHIKTSDLYNNSQLLTGKNDMKPVKNITRPILNLQHRTEDIEVKDVQLYINDPDKFHLSFLVKKYHDDVFIVENDIDTYFDELNISRIDFGGGLSKKLNKPAPEVVPLQSIAFCDQTDILSGPIGLKHFYSPDQLLDMGKYGWGDADNGATASLKEVVTLSMEEKQVDRMEGQTTKTPGRYIEVYEVHGNLPKRFADETDNSGDYETRIYIVCFYQRLTSSKKEGIILYTAPETKSPFKLIKRDPIFGRALGMGGAEELFEPQVWVNYDMIRMQSMLDAAAKTILISNDPSVAQKNNLRNMENLDIIDEAPNGNTRQLDTFPRNLAIFEKSVSQWEAHAQQMGAANDSIMGESPASGTPFKLQELVTNESHGLHEYRRGQYAKHLEEVYNDWIIPHIEKKICEGTKFLSELTLEELQYVADCLVRNEVAKLLKEKVLNGEDIPSDEEKEMFEEKTREEFVRKGNKHFIQILKGEFKGSKLGVKVSVAGKSKNLAASVDKLTNIFRFVFSNPQGFAQTMQIPGMAKAFNSILEFSGLDPVDFSGIDKIVEQQQEAEQPVESPLQPNLAQNAQ